MKKIACLFLALTATPALSLDNTKNITAEEFDKIRSYFVASGCGNQNFINSAKELNVSSTYTDDDSTPKKITSLSSDSLCLLSRSNLPEVRYTVKKNNKEIEKYAYKYPTEPNALVYEIMFTIPLKLRKECDDDTIPAFGIFYTKKDGKLTRRIHLNNDLLSCNESVLDLPKNHKYKKDNKF